MCMNNVREQLMLIIARKRAWVSKITYFSAEPK